VGFCDRFFPKRERDFFGLLITQMAKTQEGLVALEQYLLHGVPHTQDLMDDLEHRADEVRRFIIDDLNHTFITPIDRVDIYALSRAMDDIIDHATSTVAEMEVYELSPNDYVKMIGTNLKHAGEKLQDSIRHFKGRPALANEDAVRSKLLVNNMEHLYHEAIKDLAEHGDLAYMFKMREIYRRLFQLGDSIRQSNNILLDIIMKMG